MTPFFCSCFGILEIGLSADVENKKFIRHLGISYCSLYDRGFSSLGGTTNTRPNPALAADGAAKEFRPAYELVRDDQERLGRDA